MSPFFSPQPRHRPANAFHGILDVVRFQCGRLLCARCRAVEANDFDTEHGCSSRGFTKANLREDVADLLVVRPIVPTGLAAAIRSWMRRVLRAEPRESHPVRS